jgi:hypothetical protein
MDQRPQAAFLARLNCKNRKEGENPSFLPVEKGRENGKSSDASEGQKDDHEGI